MNIRKILWIINLILVVVLGWVVIHAILRQDVSRTAFGKNATMEENSPSPTSSAPGQGSRTNYDEIIKRNLFESMEPSKPDNESTVTDRNRTGQQNAGLELNLVLKGTIAGPTDIARAIIEDLSTNVTDLYKTGDIVAGAGIVRIEKNAVILTHDGQRKILRLNPLTSRSGRENDKQATSAPKIAAVVQKVNNSTQKRSEIIENFLETVRIEPYVIDGRSQGLRIDDLDKIEGAKYLGLENGDIIQVVNGQKLTNKQKAFQVFKKAGTQPYFDVELLRDNKTKTLSFPIR